MKGNSHRIFRLWIYFESMGIKSRSRVEFTENSR